MGAAASLPLAALAPDAGAREPADLRSLVAAPAQPKTNTNPFAQYLALREGALSLDLAGSASEKVDRLRMVTLSDFDGHTWSAPADYRRAGHQLPRAATTTTTREVTIDVAVHTPDILGWLPTAGRATHISTAGLGVDDGTGDIVIPTGSSTPRSYQVTGTEPIIDDILQHEPAPAATPLTIDLPPDILGFVTTATAPQPTPSGQLPALHQALTSPPFGYDGSPKAAGGHGLYQISALLRDKRGTSEQYASAFAVLCRHLGWDARVVLGFRPHWDSTKLTATGKDVHAWVEVRFNQLGWVPVDSTPVQSSPGREPPDGQMPPPARVDPIESVPPQQVPPEPSPGDPLPGPAAIASPGQPTWMTLTIIGGVSLTLVALAIPITKTIRRVRRRRTGTARTRIIAAWREALDALRQTGQHLPSPATTGDVIAAVATGIDSLPALHALARRTDYVAFAPDEANNRRTRRLDHCPKVRGVLPGRHCGERSS